MMVLSFFIALTNLRFIVLFFERFLLLYWNDFVVFEDNEKSLHSVEYNHLSSN